MSESSKQAAIREQVKMPVAGDVLTLVTTFNYLSGAREDYAVSYKDALRQDAPLVRVHSECETGDVFHSLLCDCGAQLQEAQTKMAEDGGIILYMKQEGRGIGFYGKIDAYAQQQRRGLNTYEANEALGFAADDRDYKAAAEMLQALGVRRIRLLTNNPRKVEELRAYGIEVAEIVRTGTYPSAHNHAYLETKRDVTGHTLEL